ncbi:hypothetical protein ACP4OV_019872 [Aristida adscensionis]
MSKRQAARLLECGTRRRRRRREADLAVAGLRASPLVSLMLVIVVK